MRAPSTGYVRYGKRMLDVALASVGLLLVVPVLVLLGMVSALVMREAPWFVQARPGRYGHLFNCLKLKTLRTLYGVDGALLPDAHRLTWWGSLLRRSSIDELPQLWNVLKGEMSLVGPRPLLPEYAAHYTERQRLREGVRPGLTGLAQLAGRNSLSWPEQLELDAKYTEQVSLRTDLQLLLRTPMYLLRGVVLGEGIRSEGQATRQTFIEWVRANKSSTLSSLSL